MDVRALAGGFELVEMGLEGNTCFWFSLSSLLHGCCRDVANGHKFLLLCSPSLMDGTLQAKSPINFSLKMPFSDMVTQGK